MTPAPSGGSGTRRRFYAVWYFCIAAGFVLLGIRAYVLGAVLWTVVLRWIIAAGFGLLAWLEWRRAKAK